MIEYELSLPLLGMPINYRILIVFPEQKTITFIKKHVCRTIGVLL